mmetsp:Transcript_63262/g.193527  ORF Transcript_63262/g.193527 Transcript_63262/m.193527 type:complete len:228 (-) Transcript_63262:298-981(-)
MCRHAGGEGWLLPWRVLLAVPLVVGPEAREVVPRCRGVGRGRRSRRLCDLQPCDRENVRPSDKRRGHRALRRRGRGGGGGPLACRAAARPRAHRPPAGLDLPRGHGLRIPLGPAGGGGGAAWRTLRRRGLGGRRPGPWRCRGGDPCPGGAWQVCAGQGAAGAQHYGGSRACSERGGVLRGRRNSPGHCGRRTWLAWPALSPPNCGLLPRPNPTLHRPLLVRPSAFTD